MNAPESLPAMAFTSYASRVQRLLGSADWSGATRLAREMRDCWATGRQVFICGNGGSAGNAMHLANDFLYGVSKGAGQGMRVTALPANASVVTCLANDVGYDEIFSYQLAVQARPGDVLIALSGSGDSPNIVKALEQASARGLRTFAILGFGGGKARAIAEVAIHFAIDDMQIAEDMQLVVGHMIMQWLRQNPPAGAH